MRYVVPQSMQMDSKVFIKPPGEILIVIHTLLTHGPGNSLFAAHRTWGNGDKPALVITEIDKSIGDRPDIPRVSDGVFNQIHAVGGLAVGDDIQVPCAGVAKPHSRVKVFPTYRFIFHEYLSFFPSHGKAVLLSVSLRSGQIGHWHPVGDHKITIVEIKPRFQRFEDVHLSFEDTGTTCSAFTIESEYFLSDFRELIFKSIPRI
jgi:hypothetical protein